MPYPCGRCRNKLSLILKAILPLLLIVLYMFCNAKLASECIFYGWVDPLMAVIFFLLVIPGKETCAYLMMKNSLISHLFLKMRKAPFSKLDLWLMSPKIDGVWIFWSGVSNFHRYFWLIKLFYICSCLIVLCDSSDFLKCDSVEWLAFLGQCFLFLLV